MGIKGIRLVKRIRDPKCHVWSWNILPGTFVPHELTRCHISVANQFWVTWELVLENIAS